MDKSMGSKYLKPYRETRKDDFTTEKVMLHLWYATQLKSPPSLTPSIPLVIVPKTKNWIFLISNIGILALGWILGFGYRTNDSLFSLLFHNGACSPFVLQILTTPIPTI